ncbi:hypothetical protein FPQ18DRAFT_304457 [Pyronema domesticum]|nr:hypothetical protein FPQ18DRAFT_304457 [Pyronema domesticum]
MSTLALSPSQASPSRSLQRSYNSMAIGDLLNNNSEERPQKYQRVGGREDGYKFESNMGYAMGPPGGGGSGVNGHGGNLGHPAHLQHVNNGGHDRMNGHMMNVPNGGHPQPGHERNNHGINGGHGVLHGHPGHERNGSHSSHGSSGSNISNIPNLTETNRIQLLLNTPEPERSSQQGQQQSQISIHVQSQQLQHTQHSQTSQTLQASQIPQIPQIPQASHGSQATHGSQTQQAQQRANTPGAISVASTAGSPPNSQYLTVDKRSFLAARVVCDTCGEGFTCDSLLRLDNFRNHLKKLHSTKDELDMGSFLKQAESECRVEVTPEEVAQQESQSQSANSLAFAARKNKKLQWVITSVDSGSGSLHRPRPAYYGPLEEDSSDMDLSSDLETSPKLGADNGRGYTMMPMSPGMEGMEGPVSPGIPLGHAAQAQGQGNQGLNAPNAPNGLHAQPQHSGHPGPNSHINGHSHGHTQGQSGHPGPNSHGQPGHHQSLWTPTPTPHPNHQSLDPREEESRRKRMLEIQAQKDRMRREIENLEMEYRALEEQGYARGTPTPVLGPRNGYQSHGQDVGARDVRDVRSAPNMEMDIRDGIYRPVYTQLPEDARAPRELRDRERDQRERYYGDRAEMERDGNGDNTNSMLSPPDSVEEPEGEFGVKGSGAPGHPASNGVGAPAVNASSVAIPSTNGHTNGVHPVSEAPYPTRPRPPPQLQPQPQPQPQQGFPANQQQRLPPAPTTPTVTRKPCGAPVEKIYRCCHPGCKSTFARNCELRKHRKRHTRPYGCTARYCQRLFGSKNDWKRHENSQHHRLESWKCLVPLSPSSSDICRAIHYRKENFVNHLKSSAHLIRSDQDIKYWAEKSYIGGSGHHVFWCGFCVDEETGRPGKTVRLKNEGLAGWDERFNHLGSHFEGGRRIREYCYQEEDTLGAGECPSLSESDDDDESLGLGEFGTQPPPQPGYGGFGTGEGLQRLADAAAKVASPMIGQQEEGLRKVVPLQREKRKLQQTGETWYCCNCIHEHGFSQPLSTELSPSCMDCEHARCQACSQETVQPLDEPAGATGAQRNGMSASTGTGTGGRKRRAA